MAAKKAAAKRPAKKRAATTRSSRKKPAAARKPAAKKRAAKKPAAASSRAAAPAAAKPASKPPAKAPAKSPGRNRGLLIAAGVLAVLAVIALVVVLVDSGDDGGDGNAADAAGPALARVDAAMQDVFDTFELPALTRFDEAQTPYGKFRDEVLGPRQAMLASFSAEERDYEQMLGAIEEARGVLDQDENELATAGDDAEAYVEDARAFLDDYEADVKFLQAAQALDRRTEEGYRPGDSADQSTDTVMAEVTREVARLERITMEYAELQPPPDLERLGHALRALNATQLQQQKILRYYVNGLGDGAYTISGIDIRIDGGAPARRVQAALTALQERSELNSEIASLEEQADALARDLD